jgi:hypothetical protein
LYDEGVNVKNWLPPSAEKASEHAMSRQQRLSVMFMLAAMVITTTSATESVLDLRRASTGVRYTNVVVAEVPWSIHVVKLERGRPGYEIQSRHAGGGALGLSTLSDQISATNPASGTPIAAINGGFYRRENVYAGCPRGLQIVEGEVLSAPSGNASFWIDVVGEAHLTNVTSRFEVTWPDGGVTPFGLNGERPNDGVELYTPAAGTSTHTVGGRELVLERQPGSRWLPLRMGRNYTAHVREIRREGNTSLGPDRMVLSLGPGVMDRFQGVGPGAVLRIATASVPTLLGARTALSGGPLLVRNGKRQRIRSAPDDPYELSSMLEQHPRTAFGWNKQWYFLVQVDGRQRDLSVGMTLDELSAWLVKLGCEEALNLDGGGSSSLWFEGRVRNNPCDGYERTIANSLVVVRRKAGEKSGVSKGPPELVERSKGNGK